MASWLSAFKSGEVVGLCIGEKDIAIVQLAGTLVGPIEIRRETLPYSNAEQLPEILDQLMEVVGIGKPNRATIPVAVGLAIEKVFYTTRPIRTDNNTASPQILLHEALQSAAITVDDMVVDVVKSYPQQRKVASIAACRKKYLQSITTNLENRGARLLRAEPAPCALIRAAAYKHPNPRKSHTLARVFLGDGQGVAVVLSANVPLVWRSFRLPASKNDYNTQGEIQKCIPVETIGTAIRSVIRGLQTVIVHCGVNAMIDTLLIHGKSDLHQAIEQEFAEETSVTLQLFDGPELSSESVAFGLAVGGLRANTGWGNWLDGFDLAQSLKPPAKIRDIFPWRELTIQVVFVLLWAGYLLFQLHGLNQTYRQVQAEIQTEQQQLMGMLDPIEKKKKGFSEAELRKEKQELSAKVEAVRHFVESRTLWTVQAGEVASRLPKGATLLSLQGVCDLEDTGSKRAAGGKVRKGLILRASAPIESEKTVPMDIDRFVTSLRSAPQLQKAFPMIELGDIRWSQVGKGSPPLATFTIACLSRVQNPSSGTASQGGKSNSKTKK